MRAELTPRAPRRTSRGQALILTVLLMLFVTVAVFLTFTIGTRTRRKIQLQAVADSTAYSLAVAEARAFNFYAFSNRALVAHNVSILSVHAHTSYLSFYEDLLAATANNYSIMAQSSTGDRKAALERIADLYLNSDFTPDGKHCHYVNGRCVLDELCDGAETCTVDDNRIRGAQWIHDQWHAKDNSNSCSQLLDGSRDHFRKVEFLRAHQLAVQSQLRLMMTGDDSDMMPHENRMRLDESTDKGTYNGLEAKITNLPPNSLAQNLAWLADRSLTAEPSAGKQSLKYYNRAVDDGMRDNYQKDFNEILAGTRYPAFITQRGFQNDQNWRRLQKAATRIANRLGVGTTSDVTSRGSTRLLRIEDLNDDPGQFNNVTGPLTNVWPPVFSNSPPPPAPTPRPSATPPLSGRRLSLQLHREGHDSTGFGEGDGIASEDHGWVASRFGGQRATTVIDQGRNAVWGDPHDWRGSGDHNRPGDDTTHSFHIWHGDLGKIPAHGNLLGKCDDLSCSNGQRGVYRGHMRFKASSDADNLWNMPRTVSLITRPMDRAPKRWPWDFSFTAEIPGHLEFRTIDTEGDTRTNSTMGAFAGGLVYFHKPVNGLDREEYLEPPNFWNPFWRAKLHPVLQSDAEDVSDTGHRATYLMLLQLNGWRAVNY